MQYVYLTAVTSAVALAASAAQAAFVVEVSSGPTTLTFTDGDNDGTIVGTGRVGDFVTTVTVAVSNSPGGSGNAQLQITNISFTNLFQGERTLTVQVRDTDFTMPSGDVFIDTSFGGTLTLGTNPPPVRSVTFQGFVDDTNTDVFGVGATPGLLSQLVTGLSPIDVVEGSGSSTTSVTGPFALSSILTITVGGGASANISGSVLVTPVPEPLAACAMSLMGLVALRRRR